MDQDRTSDCPFRSIAVWRCRSWSNSDRGLLKRSSTEHLLPARAYLHGVILRPKWVLQEERFVRRTTTWLMLTSSSPMARAERELLKTQRVVAQSSRRSQSQDQASRIFRLLPCPCRWACPPRPRFRQPCGCASGDRRCAKYSKCLWAIPT